MEAWLLAKIAYYETLVADPTKQYREWAPRLDELRIVLLEFQLRRDYPEQFDDAP
jgi:hypothetical protein